MQGNANRLFVLLLEMPLLWRSSLGQIAGIGIMRLTVIAVAAPPDNERNYWRKVAG